MSDMKKVTGWERMASEPSILLLECGHGVAVYFLKEIPQEYRCAICAMRRSLQRDSPR